jgi:23S rRNA (uracil1939-C5)-methyltransferase
MKTTPDMPSPQTSVLDPQTASPPCPHFGLCGGCQLQHLTYAAQLNNKASQLRALLEATGLAFPELQLHPSPPLAYRNRIRLTLAEVDGRLRAGYLASAPPEPSNLEPRTTNRAFIPITQCPIAAPVLWRTTEALLDLLNADPALWLRTRITPDQLELFTTADESRLQLTLTLRAPAKSLPNKFISAFTALCESLHTRILQLTGAGIAILLPRSTQRSRRTEVPRPGPTWGATGLNYSVSLPAPNNQQPATSYWVPRGAFFQANRFLLPELLAHVTNNRTGTLAFDLYAGVGLFSRTLTANFTQVTGVEIAEPAFSALASTKLKNLHAVRAATLDFLRAAVLHRDRPSLIVLDPPRSGAGPEVCALLARISAPSLVYVSCSPENLPADLVTLTAAGYTLAELHLFDLFPQTTHIETVTILTR